MQSVTDYKIETASIKKEKQFDNNRFFFPLVYVAAAVASRGPAAILVLLLVRPCCKYSPSSASDLETEKPSWTEQGIWCTYVRLYGFIMFNFMTISCLFRAALARTNVLRTQNSFGYVITVIRNVTYDPSQAEVSLATMLISRCSPAE